MAECILPEDLMVCILTRLPVKSVLRFKSVCKQWRHLLSTPEFVKLHHAQFSRDPKGEHFFIEFFVSMSLFKIEPSTVCALPCPKTISNMGSVGCCNGLICMGRWRVEPGNIVLWNPALKLFKFVGLSRNVDNANPERVSSGFGYDAELDDYKIVRIFYLGEGEEEDLRMDMVEVYSVNSDSWIKIEPGFQFLASKDINDVIVNGNPYWIAKVDVENHPGDVLVCFDVKRMVFRIVPLSSPTIDEYARFLDWNGYLGAIVCTFKCHGVESIDVWVFDDGEQLWKKNHTFVGPSEMDCGWELMCKKNGKIVAMCQDGQLFVFDSDIGSIKEVDIAEPYPFEIYPYTESLVYINGMKHLVE